MRKQVRVRVRNRPKRRLKRKSQEPKLTEQGAIVFTLMFLDTALRAFQKSPQLRRHLSEREKRQIAPLRKKIHEAILA